ncbi:MAG TPA: hypothetical protein VGY30_05180 [Solirubrobacteraceae bacterium]|jgi:hypothetical protein|nr:hypothetical protein [Solirubrobacteraceae bacterium]
MAVEPVFVHAPIGKGMYESFYLRAVAPDEPVGVWIRYTVHKRPGQPAQGSLWCTVFDAERGAPFMHKHTTRELLAPAGGWIEIGGDSGRFGPGFAEGSCGPASWSLRISDAEPELRHLKQAWLYRAPLPRTKLTSPAPAASFDGTFELPDRTIELRGWRGMVGHNWGAEHAERWIWLHGIDFAEDHAAWLDVALGRVLVAGRLTPWMASGAISLDDRRLRLGGLGARGLRVAESTGRCSLTLPGEGGLVLEAHVDSPPGAAAGWRYADPDGGEHDVVNCSVASLSLNVRPHGGAATTLHTAHGAAYELGMRTLKGTGERDHGVALAPFGDG